MEGAGKIIESIDKTSKKLFIGDTAFAGVGLTLKVLKLSLIHISEPTRPY